MGNNISLSQIEKKWVKEWTGSDTVVYAKYNFQPIGWLLHEVISGGIHSIVNHKAEDMINTLFNAREALISYNSEDIRFSNKDYRMALDFIGKVLIECMKNMDATIVT